MQASEYQRAARTTALYPTSAAVYYPAMGLVGEIGELCNKAKKIIRGDVTFEQRLEDFKKELGDVLWYVAGVASDLGITFEEVVNTALEGSAPQETGDLDSTLLRLAKAAGDIAGAADEIKTHGLTTYRRVFTQSRLEQAMRGVTRLCAIFGVELGEVCKANIKKLFERKKTGTIRGDGDNREMVGGLGALDRKSADELFDTIFDRK
jgi:hypothetical protein